MSVNGLAATVAAPNKVAAGGVSFGSANGIANQIASSILSRERLRFRLGKKRASSVIEAL